MAPIADSPAEQAVPLSARRAEWEGTMQVFGVAAGVDALSRRRHGPRPAPVATRAEVGRRAAEYGDIVDLMGKRHFPAPPEAGVIGATEGPWKPDAPGAPSEAGADAERKRKPCVRQVPGKSAKAGAGGVLPFDSACYDAAGPSRPASRRQFFDGQVHADRYAELIGRPPRVDPCAPEQHGSGSRPRQDIQLPLSIRRALEAALPAAHDPSFPADVNSRIRAQVEAMVLKKYTRSRRQTMAPGMGAKKTVSSSQASTCLLQDSTQETPSTTLFEEPSPAEEPREGPRLLEPPAAGGLPTLLSPRRGRASGGSAGGAVEKELEKA